MEQRLLSLLAAGLNDAMPCNACFTDVSIRQWQELYRMSLAQSVLGVVFDGICKLPPEMRPPRPFFLKWLGIVLKLEGMNERMNDMIVELNNAFTDKGLHPILLKGQGLAACYPNPLHRQCGDIDILFEQGEQPSANDLLIKRGATETKEESSLHNAYAYKGIEVENHKKMGHLHNPFSNRYFNRLVKDCNIFSYYTADKNMATPPDTLNAVYVLLHAFRHFTTHGIGLRHICDWGQLLRAKHENIDLQALAVHLKKMHMDKAAKCFGWILIHRLNFPSEYFPFSVEGYERQGERFLRNVLCTGDFGHYDKDLAKRPEEYFAGKWFSWNHSVKRSLKSSAFCPSEFYWYLACKLIGAVRVEFKRINGCQQKIKESKRENSK